METNTAMLLFLLVGLFIVLLLVRAHSKGKTIVNLQTAATTIETTVRTIVFNLTASHTEFLTFFELCVMYHLQGLAFQVLTQDGRSITVWAALQSREGYLRDRAFKHDDSFALDQCLTYLHGLYDIYGGISRSCRKVIPQAVRTRLEEIFQAAFANPNMATLGAVNTEFYELCTLLLAEKPKSASTVNINQAYWDFNTSFVLFSLGEGGRTSRRKEYDEFIEFVFSKYTEISLFNEN